MKKTTTHKPIISWTLTCEKSPLRTKKLRKAMRYQMFSAPILDSVSLLVREHPTHQPPFHIYFHLYIARCFIFPLGKVVKCFRMSVFTFSIEHCSKRVEKKKVIRVIRMLCVSSATQKVHKLYQKTDRDLGAIMSCGLSCVAYLSP